MLGGVSELVTKGQRVIPARALALGYQFQYPELTAALRQIFAKPKPTPKPKREHAAAGSHHHGHH